MPSLTSAKVLFHAGDGGKENDCSQIGKRKLLWTDKQELTGMKIKIIDKILNLYTFNTLNIK